MLGCADELRDELRRIHEATSANVVVQIIESRDDPQLRRWPESPTERRRITAQSLEKYLGDLLVDRGDAMDRAVSAAIADRPTRIWIISDGTFDNFDSVAAALKEAHARDGTIVNITAVGDFNEAPARWKTLAKDCGGVYSERAPLP